MVSRAEDGEEGVLGLCRGRTFWKREQEQMVPCWVCLNSKETSEGGARDQRFGQIHDI